MIVKKGVKLNIGCGRSPKSKEDGYLNCDLYPGSDVDVAFDACDKWPFENESVMAVECEHTLEHLPNYFNFFKEAWRVLIPNGQLKIRVPYGWHQSAWWDFTHLRPWLQESFATLQPGFTHFTRNYQHEYLGIAFWVVNVVLVFERPWARMWRFAPLRPLAAWAGRHLLNVYRDLVVEAVKTTEDDERSAAWGGPFHPATVPCSYGVMEHEYYGRSAEGLPHHVLLIFGNQKYQAVSGHG